MIKKFGLSSGADYLRLLKPKENKNYFDKPTYQEIALPLIKIRFTIRRIAITLRQRHDEANQHRRKARQIKQQGDPFSASKIKKLVQAANTIRVNSEPLRAKLKECGNFLADFSNLVDSCTTLAQRCELLNVNVADRSELKEADGLADIIFAHGLEDSAEHRGKEFNEGIMFDALRLVFMDFLTETREGQRIGDSLLNDMSRHVTPCHAKANVPLLRLVDSKPIYD